MGALLSYSIVSGVVLMCLYLVFLLALSNKNQHGYNRGVALAIYAVSFLAFPVKWMAKSGGTGIHTDVETVTAALPTIAVAEVDSPASWGTVLIWIYIAGMAVVGAMTVWTWLKILAVICRGERMRRDGFTLVLVDDEHVAPFSWMRFVVMSRRDYADCGATILIHECRHITLCHWIDLLVAQAAVVVNWFNPAVWLLREEMMLVHEYQADMAVIESGCNALQYQMILIKKAAGARFPSLANSLNHSNLKKRITMMYEKKSSKGQRLGALALVPAAALALSLTAVPSVNAAISQIESSGLSLGKVTENPDTKHIVSSVSYQVNIDFRDNQTKIKLTSEQFASAKIANVLLVADGEPYKPQAVNTNVDDGVGTIDLNFGQLPKFKSGTLTFDCGEKTVTVSIKGEGEGGGMSSVVHISGDDKIPDNAVVHTAQTQIKVKPSDTDISITTTENGGTPTKWRLVIDKSKVTDGVAYIYNGRQITKAEFEAISPSTISNVTVLDDKDGVKVVLVVDKKGM